VKAGDVKPDANPGVPFTNLGCSKNSDVFSRHFDLLVDMVVEQVIFMVVFGQAFHSMTSSDLIAFGLWDPVRLFIKNEPHSEAKLKEGRLRLIANVSLRTQLIERWLCGYQNDLEIAQWYKLPVMPGIGLDDDSLALVTEKLRKMSKFESLAMTDVSGWDWSVKPWLLWADAERRRIAAGAELNGCYDSLLKMRAFATGSSVYALSDGSLVAQETAGIQNSGSYCTSSTNSWMRVILYLVARAMATDECPQMDWLEDVIAMGDDCVEVFVPGVLDWYLKMGFKCSLSKRVESAKDIEFCSHLFDGLGLAYPTSTDRTLFRFFSGKPGAELVAQLAQLEFVLRHHPQRGHYMTIARSFAFAAEANNCDKYGPPLEKSDLSHPAPAEQGAGTEAATGRSGAGSH